MDKQMAMYTYSGVLLSGVKEQTHWYVCSHMNKSQLNPAELKKLDSKSDVKISFTWTFAEKASLI